MPQEFSLENLTMEQIQDSARTLHGMLNSPATRDLTLRAIKHNNPNAVLPELDTKMEFAKQLQAEREERLKLKEEMQIDQINRRIEKERQTIKDKYSLSDNEVLEVEKLMVDKEAPIPSYEGAAKVYRASQQSAVPTTSHISPPIYEMPDKDIWAAGIGNRQALDKIAMSEAYKVWNEQMASKGKIRMPA